MNFKAILLKYTLMGLMMLIPFSVLARKKELTHIDSLLKQLHTAGEDTNKVRLLLNTGVGYSNTKKQDSAVFFTSRPNSFQRSFIGRKGLLYPVFPSVIITFT
jgi:hypothetical protein